MTRDRMFRERWQVSPAVAALHRDALVCDMVWPLEPWCGNDWDRLEQFHAAGVDLVSLTLAGDNHNVSETVQRVAAARHKVFSAPEQFVLVESTADIEQAKAGGRLAVGFHFEGTRCFERNTDLVETFYRLGVRHALLAFNQGNSVGGGCGERADGGLTRFGEQLVAEMNRVGMIVDLSHTGRQTTLDAMAITTRPVLFSHSNAAGLVPHFRNIDDVQVRACAASGGMVGVSSSSEYLGEKVSSAQAMFRHIDYYVNLVGPEHVGLGLDIVFDHSALNAWIRTRPDEWPGTEAPDWPGFRYATPADYPALTGLMLDAGYAQNDIRGILGGNFLRVCAANWMPA